MDGIFFLLNEAGVALLQARERIARLEARVAELEQSTPPVTPA